MNLNDHNDVASSLMIASIIPFVICANQPCQEMWPMKKQKWGPNVTISFPPAQINTPLQFISVTGDDKVNLSRIISITSVKTGDATTLTISQKSNEKDASSKGMSFAKLVLNDNLGSSSTWLLDSSADGSETICDVTFTGSRTGIRNFEVSLDEIKRVPKCTTATNHDINTVKWTKAYPVYWGDKYTAHKGTPDELIRTDMELMLDGRRFFMYESLYKTPIQFAYKISMRRTEYDLNKVLPRTLAKITFSTQGNHDRMDDTYIILPGGKSREYLCEMLWYSKQYDIQTFTLQSEIL